MREEKFGNIFLFAPKSKVKAGDGLEKGMFPFFTSSQTLSKRIDTEQYFDEALVFGTGGSASIHYVNELFSTSTDCIVTVNRKEYVKTKYVYYYLLSNIHILERGFKGAGLKHISKSYIEELKIPIPEPDLQEKIIAVLDKAKLLLEKRHMTIIYYENFLNSTFLEMFGSKNPDFKYWEDVEIGSFKKVDKGSMRTGPFGSSLKHERFKEKGEIAVIGIDNAVDNVFKWKQKRFLGIDEFEEFKKYQVFPRDVIITIMGTVGRSAVIPENIGLAINTKHLAALTLNESLCNPYYLAYSIHSNPFIRYQLKARARGAVMEGFNLTLIKELKLKNAPIGLQNKFEKIYLKCAKDIENLKLAKTKLENLFSALSQLAFKGTLKFNTAVDLEVMLEYDYEFFQKNSSAQSIQLLLERLDKDRLDDKRFYDRDLYDKARSFVFELLRDEKVKQVFDEKTKKVKLIV
jgi:type I restriction enzyme, S subunit